MRRLIVIAGPTASGKTDLAIQLAKQVDAEIISCDSRQFYRGMDIGTAKPSRAERAAVPHHFMDIKNPDEDYNAGQYEADVIAFLTQYFDRNSQAILVGGSGLYIKAVLEGFDDLPGDAEVRNKWNEIHLQQGISALQVALKDKDSVAHDAMDNSNPHRLIRALEVIEITGQKFSDLKSKTKKERPFETKYFSLNPNRDDLYAHINNRVDSMIESGLEREVRQLLPYRTFNALKTVGYKEILDAIDGKMSLDQAVSKIKQHTRNYAKRQFTWFRSQPNCTQIDSDYLTQILRQL